VLLVRMRFSATFVLLALLLLVAVIPAAALEVPRLTGRVNDYAGMLASSTVSQLEGVLAELERTDSTQIVVLTVPSLQGDSLEDFSLRVVENWKIGQQKVDNGALLLIARDDRKLRIEVGYGLEGRLTDLVAGQIIRNVITPRFRQGDFNQGVIDGVTAMVAAVKGEFTAPANSNANRPEKQGDVGGLITALLFVYFFFGSMFRRSKLLAAGTGAVLSPLLGFLLFGITGLALLGLAFIGLVGGLVASAMASSSGSGRGGGGMFIPGGGFGGSSGGFGGFSGGGGGFGGGGASGGW